MTEAAGYATYATHLRAFVQNYPDVPRDEALSHLNGRAATTLRSTVSLVYRRGIGAFFTSSQMRARVSAAIAERGYGGPYFDPACGAGDLLLAAAEYVDAVAQTCLSGPEWSELLHGCDIEPHFTDVARSRLRLFAASSASRVREYDHFATTATAADSHVRPASNPRFRRVRAGNGLTRLVASAPFTGTILLNPPFGNTDAPAGCSWSSGKVPRAAIFAEEAVRSLAPGSGFVAILPDVLRSGSRHHRWRALISALLDIERLEVLGQFDEHTDIDVFLLAGRRRESPAAEAETAWCVPPSSTALRVKDLFDVRVGSVVDNRDPHEGPVLPYVTARSMPTSGTVALIEGRRSFSGTTRTPPFVLVRRTNRPSQGQSRARGVLVIGEEPVAIDNHLLVALPKDGTIETCRALTRALDHPAVDEFLDERIRCRHLTVEALGETPMRQT